MKKDSELLRGFAERTTDENARWMWCEAVRVARRTEQRIAALEKQQREHRKALLRKAKVGDSGAHKKGEAA